MRLAIYVALLCVAGTNVIKCHAAEPASTAIDSKHVLAELVTIPGSEIPARLLAEAHAVVIVPRVIKVGLVAGARRGHGVVLVRSTDGTWGLPRFVTLTGGSLGWQVGVSGTDVVLVFTTERSVNGLLNGKFTIGVDAAAAAGPVGRNAAAATDTSLQAEILSYSRSRGLFIGASIDGSAIEFNHAANTAFYGSPDPLRPQTIPAPAIELQSFVTHLTSVSMPVVQPHARGAIDPATATGPAATGVAPAVAAIPAQPDQLRSSLLAAHGQLSQLLSPDWARYLALPAGLYDARAPADLAALQSTVARFDAVAADGQYRDLASRFEFQSARQLLRDFLAASRSQTPQLDLPAPPATR